jgi:hypothetical protein
MGWTSSLVGNKKSEYCVAIKALVKSLHRRQRQWQDNDIKMSVKTYFFKMCAVLGLNVEDGFCVNCVECPMVLIDG